MELTAAIALLVAVAVPFVVALITRPDWSANRKRNVAVGVSVVIAVIVALATGKISGVPDAITALIARILVAGGIIVSLAQGYYSAFKGALTAIEAATSPKTPAAAVPAAEPAAAEPTVTVVQTGTTVYEPGNGDPSTKTLS